MILGELPKLLKRSSGNDLSTFPLDDDMVKWLLVLITVVKKRERMGEGNFIIEDDWNRLIHYNIHDLKMYYETKSL